MTIDLYLWKAPRVHDPFLADLRLREHLDGSARLESSPELVRFADQLAERFPDASLAAGLAGGAWRAPIERSDRLVVLHVDEEAPSELLEAIPRLAWEHDLVLFDPRAS